MQQGAGSTQAQPQTQETTILSINGKAVKNAAELQAALDAIPAGTAVKIVYKVDGKERVIEGAAK
jgi:S1-C subfamily serine protease